MLIPTFAARDRSMGKLSRLLKNFHSGFSSLHKMSPMSDLSERYCYNPTLHWNPHVEEYFIKAYGADHFASISKALTHPCCYSCIRVNILKTTSDAVIEKLSTMLHGTSNGNAMNGINICEMEDDRNSDMGQIQENFTKEYTLHYNPKGHDKIATKSLDDLDLLDGCLKHGPVFKCHIPGLDYVVFVRGTGPHKVEYAYAPDQPSKEVIVSRKCAESVLRGAQVYVPGVLACSAHVEKGDAVAVSVAVEQPESDGKWGIGITRGIVLHSLQTDPHFSQRKGLYIGQGTTMMPRAGIFRALEGVAIRMTSRVFDLPSFNDVLEGEIFLQNLPSIITAHVLDPQKGERILDMCAAPGGKTTAIAMLMKDDGEVVAVDRSHNKVQYIQNLAAEMGLKSIVAYKLDALKAVSQRNESNDINASKFVEDSPSLELLKSESNNTNNDNVLRKEICVNGKENLQKSITTANTKRSNQRTKNGPGKNQVGGGRVEKSKGFSPSSFDRVLLDAPCSALGLRPRLFAGEETLESLRNHARYQRRMFDQAVQLVQAGGVIVYSTCTINPGENEALVRYALDTYKFLSLAPQHPSVGGPGLIGCYNFSDGHVEEWLRPSEAELVQRFDPSLVDTIGFFIAKFNVGSKDE